MSIGPVLVELWKEEVEQSNPLSFWLNFWFWFFNFFPSLLHYYWTNWHVLYPKMWLIFKRKKMGSSIFVSVPIKWAFLALQIYVLAKKWIFPNLIFQLHPIITQLILNQFACSLPKTNTTFHQLFKYVSKSVSPHQ